MSDSDKKKVINLSFNNSDKIALIGLMIKNWAV